MNGAFFDLKNKSKRSERSSKTQIPCKPIECTLATLYCSCFAFSECGFGGHWNCHRDEDYCDCELVPIQAMPVAIGPVL